MTFREQFKEELEEAKAEAREEAAKEAEKKGLEQGRAEGEKNASVKNAKNLLQMNILTPQQISQAVSLPVEEVLKLQEEITV